jgi:hypothetical protein
MNMHLIESHPFFYICNCDPQVFPIRKEFLWLTYWYFERPMLLATMNKSMRGLAASRIATGCQSRGYRLVLKKASNDSSRYA